MKQRIETIIIAIVISLAILFVAYFLVPISFYEWVHGLVRSERNFGATITTIQATDRLTDSRAVINTNFSNLNTDLEATIATTSMNGILTLNNLTTAGSLATVGTITSGIWNGTTLAVANGGTGSTTLSQYSVLLGSSTNAIGIVSGLGTSGQFLTSQGTGARPTWTTSAIDQAGTYAWTGAHSWSNTFAIFNTGTSTISSGLEVGRLISSPYFHATSTTATSTFSGVEMVSATTTSFVVSNSIQFGSYEIKSQGGNMNGGSPSTAVITVTCSAGKKVVGGGVSGPNITTTTGSVDASYPDSTTSWTVRLKGPNGNTDAVTAYAICI